MGDIKELKYPCRGCGEKNRITSNQICGKCFMKYSELDPSEPYPKFLDECEICFDPNETIYDLLEMSEEELLKHMRRLNIKLVKPGEN